MIIDFVQIQKQKFEELVEKIMAQPEQYLDFDSVSDFYKAPWLDHFPQGTRWSTSGLDDGAEEFCIQIKYRELVFNIEIQSTFIRLKFNSKSISIYKKI
ncbi:hypothetical protein M2R48_16470 [Acinetobacter sp. I-MWF]|jgi:hypothetical protein|uniref:hypothetical protein n=1 Tax=Acinetobacter TaxID=469 RepID=UPI0021CA12B0|nr:hypothetical protein [Acinetobacter sp. I-MWF]MCT9979931.1 hypothetical protein [Acinetobacter sp. I-MWF]